MASPDSPRPVCLRCHKPQVLCICQRITRVRNRTPVWIFQHHRERFHPIGTARIARLGLENVELRVCFAPTSESPADLPDGAALLYPGGEPEPLQSLAPQRHPRALVLIDGTWSQAHCIHRDNPWLQQLPHYQLAQPGQGRYRIRRAPEPGYLSTIEAIVQALSFLEPDTEGLAGLIESFDSMIDDQLGFVTELHAGGRQRTRRAGTSRTIPRVFNSEPSRLLVAYGESSGRGDKRHHSTRQVVQWAAVRPDTGAVFERLVQPERCRPSVRHLGHMGLGQVDLDRGVSVQQLRSDWDRFCTRHDTVVAWNQSSLDLLRSELRFQGPALLLKAAYCNAHPGQDCGTLDEVIAGRADAGSHHAPGPGIPAACPRAGLARAASADRSRDG
jgi:DTW domain-containing protein YfiP